jgi:hypothetical protein
MSNKFIVAELKGIMSLPTLPRRQAGGKAGSRQIFTLWLWRERRKE